MIDTHAHFYDEYFLNDLDLHLNDLVQSGIKEVWLPNCDSNTLLDLINLTKKFPELFLPMLGLHPTYVKDNYLDELKFIKSYIDDTPNLLAIGEIGLDYYWDTSYKNEQMDAFIQQCNWALDLNIWVDIHCRKAYADLIKVIRKPEFKDLRGIVHCFSGDASEAKHCIDNGFFLGIGGVITYKNSNLFESIKDISLDHIVLETDAPYLTPVPYRGTPNSSKYIPLIAEKLADLYQMDLNMVIEKTTQNANFLKNYSGIE
ncbi:MAG: 3-5 ssDNA/RNA exonuclease TatD [Bacteroidota bacterium]|jgi:TatD DNase family protein